MVSLLISTIILCSISTVLGIPVLDFYFPSRREAPNVFRFECRDLIDGMAYPDARFEINDSMGVLIRNQSTDINEEYFTYDITEDFEASVRCITGEEYSKAIMFYAIPTVSNQTTMTGAFRDDTYTMLTCPIPLPTVRSSYTIIWEQLVDSTPIQVMNDSESRGYIYILSQDNRTLSVSNYNSSDEMVLRCKVILKRSSDPQRCPLDTILGPLMEFLILERSEISVFPSTQNITNGDTAIFQCNAMGSNISLRWTFNGSSCDPDSCEQNGISKNETQSMNSNSFIINTTLEIKTGEVHSIIMEKKTYTIQCIVEQNLGHIQMSGTINATVTLTVLPRQEKSTTIATSIQPLTSDSPTVHLPDSPAATTQPLTSNSPTPAGPQFTIIGVGVGIAAISLIAVIITIIAAKIRINVIQVRTLSLKETGMLPTLSITEENHLHSVPCVTIEQNEQSDEEKQEFEISDDDPNYSTVRSLKGTPSNKHPAFVPPHKKTEMSENMGDSYTYSIVKKRCTNPAAKNYEEIDLTPCAEESLSVEREKQTQESSETWNDSHVYSVVNKKSTKTAVKSHAEVEDARNDYLYAVVDKKKPKIQPRSSDYEELEAFQLNNNSNNPSCSVTYTEDPMNITFKQEDDAPEIPSFLM